MKLPRLVHHSLEPLRQPIQSVGQFEPGKLHGFAGYGKPEGLWMATDGGWAEYCTSINRPLGEYHYEIVVAPGANILRISTADELDQFSIEYGAGNPLDGYAVKGVPDEVRAILDHTICDWPAVAKRYQGIVIHPHIRSRHMHLTSRWYYAWDVASGCIWDATAIAEVCQLAPKVETADAS